MPQSLALPQALQEMLAATGEALTAEADRLLDIARSSTDPTIRTEATLRACHLMVGASSMSRLAGLRTVPADALQGNAALRVGMQH